MGKKKPRFLSIFSGCGGFDLGFTNEGFSCCGAIDIDTLVLEVHKTNLASRVYQEDLSSGKICSNDFRNVDVLLAGSPCQGFSTAGKRNLNDPRNELLLSAGKIALTLQPKVFVAENVPGVTAGSHGQYWKALQSMLREGGYRTSEFKCAGTEIGMAQMRVRCFLIAWNGTHMPNLNLPSLEKSSLREVLKGVSGVDDHDPIPLKKDERHFKIARRISQGQKLSNVRAGANAVHTWHIPEVFGRTNIKERTALEHILKLRRRRRVRDFGDADPLPVRLAYREYGKELVLRLVEKGYLRRFNGYIDLANAYNGKYRRLSWSGPSNTVDTRFGNPMLYLHPTEHRGFTVREAARIQEFPDSFKFSGSIREKYTMIGNAVPPTMGGAVAALVRQSFFS